MIGALSDAGQGRTVLVAAHRLSTVKQADQILVLDASGRPEAVGTHDELIERGGWYADTWERQQRRESLRAAVEEEDRVAVEASSEDASGRRDGAA